MILNSLISQQIFTNSLSNLQTVSSFSKQASNKFYSHKLLPEMEKIKNLNLEPLMGQIQNSQKLNQIKNAMFQLNQSQTCNFDLFSQNEIKKQPLNYNLIKQQNKKLSPFSLTYKNACNYSQFNFSPQHDSFPQRNYESIEDPSVIQEKHSYLSPIFTVSQQSAVVIQRLGKFHSVKHSGLQFKIPIIDQIAGIISLKVQQLNVVLEAKTLDNAFVKIKIAVQFQVMHDKIYEAFYRLQNPTDQIKSYVFDVVRAEVPKLNLDDVFVTQDNIAQAVKNQLQEIMSEYGYNIIKTLIVDIDPDNNIKNAMNRINAAQREKVAAQYEGDAKRILIVEKAKAEAESKRLQGKGIADQRREIARGLVESVGVLSDVGINSQEASAIIVVTQHYDTLQSMGEKGNSSIVLLPNMPQAGSEMLNSLVASFAASNKISEQMKEQRLKHKEEIEREHQQTQKEDSDKQLKNNFTENSQKNKKE